MLMPLRLVGCIVALGFLPSAALLRGADPMPPPAMADPSAPPLESRALDREFVARGPIHRAIVREDSSALAVLDAAGAVLWVEDYGSFTLVGFDERAAGGLAAVRAAGAELADEMTLVPFNGYRLDGADAAATEAVLAGIPELLRAPTLPPGGARLEIVQFIGPPKDAWREALLETGAFLITYAARNAYVVRVDGAASAAFARFARNPFVLSVRSYEPAFKLRPELRPPALSDTGVYDVVVQVIAGGDASAFVESLRARAIAVLFEPQPVLTYINVGLRLNGANVLDLARDPHVFAIEPKGEPRLQDERQDQIVAGNLDAFSEPTGPTYLAWLASRGFPGLNNPFDFVVDVVDSGIDRGPSVDPMVACASVASDGTTPGDGNSTYASITPDGRYLAFKSSASNLVPGDANGVPDIFVRDLVAGTLELVSVSSGGTQGNGSCYSPSISADGRYVAFASLATNLAGTDSLNFQGIFLRDRVSRTTLRVSQRPPNATEEDGECNFPSISEDGRYVAFESRAKNLGSSPDPLSWSDIFLYDREANGVIRCITTNAPGTLANGHSYAPSVASVGGDVLVAFRCDANNVLPNDANLSNDILLWRQQTDSIELVSRNSGGTAANSGSSIAYSGRSISSNARYVAFSTSATNLDPNDSIWEDVYRLDRSTGSVALMSVASDGTQGNGHSSDASVDAAGNVVFESRATTLVPDDTSPRTDVFVRFHNAGKTVRLSTDINGTEADRHCEAPVIAWSSLNYESCIVAFHSQSTNLVPGITNLKENIFIRTLGDLNDEFKVDGQPLRASRIAYQHNFTTDTLTDDAIGHGTLVASVLAGFNNATGTDFEDGDGYQYGLGVAPWVKLGNSKAVNNNGDSEFLLGTAARMAMAYSAGARISSNSWGSDDPGAHYTSECQNHDRAVRDADEFTAGDQEMVIVFVAGNEGSAASTINAPGTAKNVITVGASENWRMTGTDGCGAANQHADYAGDVHTYSSRGPTADMRKKPDILAPGTHIQGAASRASGYPHPGCGGEHFPLGQTRYTWASGTSFATPAVSGACALLRQYRLNANRDAPSPALTKALLVAGATYMTGNDAGDDLWSNSQGMGRVNLDASLDASVGFVVDQTHVFEVTDWNYKVGGTLLPSNVPFRVVLAWTDAPGPTSGNAFVNDLDLRVIVNGNIYRGNVFNGETSDTGGTHDARNNVESVFLPAGTSGAFTIIVYPTTLGGDGVPGNADATDQDFALVVYGLNFSTAKN